MSSPSDSAWSANLSDETERSRMEAVRETALLDTLPEYEFDRIVEIAAALFDAPMAVLSIVDSERIWFKARHGVNVEQVVREPGLCGSTILQDMPWVLSDARNDPRMRNHPLVTGPVGLRFYVGIPLRLRNGACVGALCVLDQKPRSIDELRMNGLSHLASIAVDQIELRTMVGRMSDSAGQTQREPAAARGPEAGGPQEFDRLVFHDMSVMTSLTEEPHAVPDVHGRGLPHVFIDGVPLGLPEGQIGALTLLIEAFLHSAFTGNAEQIHIDFRPDGSALSVEVQ